MKCARCLKQFSYDLFEEKTDRKGNYIVCKYCGVRNYININNECPANCKNQDEKED